MYEAIPMCSMCGMHEVGTFGGGHLFFCGEDCADAANAALDEMYANDLDVDYDLSDDADALASAGYGNDEDYNGYDYGDYYGGEDY